MADSKIVDLLSDPSHLFLVHTQSGQVVLRSRSQDAERQLVRRADSALYDGVLELVWLLDGDQLSVLDMRALPAPPVLIASGLPTVGHLAISRSDHSAETEDNCDVPAISLAWGTTSTVESFYEGAPDARIEGDEWLRAQLSRPKRTVGERREFGAFRIAWPKELGDCEEAAACGAAIPFGARGLQLVQVVQKMGGDCWARACVLRDPEKGLFAAPPAGQTWGSPVQTRAGSCGLFLFDRADSAFLIDRTLCVPDGPCKNLDGRALGWLLPGSVVGAPGVLAE